VWIALRKVPESRNPSPGSLDLAGALLATAGLGALVYGLIEASSVGFANARAWGTAAAGIVGLIAFVAVEVRSRQPMVPLGMFRNRTFTAANLLTLFLYAALAATFFYLPFVLIQARGYSPAAAGAALLPLIGIISALSRSAGAIADRFGSRLPLTIGPLTAAAGFVLFAVLPANAPYAASLLPALCVLGLGMSITVAPLTATVLNAVERDEQGAASGINNAVARVAGLLAIAVFGIVAAGAFNRSLDRRLDTAGVSPATLRLLEPERARLGAMKPPAGASETESRAIKEAVGSSLDASFRVVSSACAGLALVAAACGAVGVAGTKLVRRA